MKNKEEIASLHTLFLSQYSVNWQLAAMMCSESEADFEKVMELEVRRVKLMGSDINLDRPSILGSQFTWCAGWMWIDLLDDDVFVTFHVEYDFKDLDLGRVKNCWRTKLQSLKFN